MVDRRIRAILHKAIRKTKPHIRRLRAERYTQILRGETARFLGWRGVPNAGVRFELMSQFYGIGYWSLEDEGT